MGCSELGNVGPWRGYGVWGLGRGMYGLELGGIVLWYRALLVGFRVWGFGGEGRDLNSEEKGGVGCTLRAGHEWWGGCT